MLTKMWRCGDVEMYIINENVNENVEMWRCGDVYYKRKC